MKKTGLLRVFSLALAAWCGFLTSGCGEPKPIAPETPQVQLMPQLPTEAQSRLPTMKLWLGTGELTTEIARTAVQQMTGMMFRTNMAESEAMLFPMPSTRQVGFWMMNTPLPLSAAYIDPEGIIQEIHDLHPFDTNTVPSKSENIRFVLETRQGWFTRHNIGVGTAVRTEKGSLMETFFPLE